MVVNLDNFKVVEICRVLCDGGNWNCFVWGVNGHWCVVFTGILVTSNLAIQPHSIREQFNE